MQALLGFETLLFYIQVAALLAVMVRFVGSGLQHIYRFFFLYLIVQAGQDLIPVFVSRKENLYGYLFLGTEGVILLLYALIVLELYSLVLRDLQGIATLARQYIRIAITVAIAVSLLLLGLEKTPSGILGRLYTFERPIVSSLVFFVFLITGFLVYYPIPLNRNVIFYSIGYAVYFSSKAVVLFIRNTGPPGLDRMLSFWMLAVSTACLLFWVVSLSALGEKKTLVLVHKADREHEDRVLQQLEAINKVLIQARK